MAAIHIALRELRATLGTGRAWVILFFWLLVAGYFWNTFLENYLSQSQDLLYNPYAASMLSLGDYLIGPWFGNILVIFVLIGPAITVRLFTEEYTQKTIELLLTSPVRTWEIVLGKYLGAMGFVVVLLASTLHIPLVLYQFSNPDPALFVGGYLMLLLSMSVLVSMSLFIASFTESQMLGVMGAVALGLILLLLSWVADDPDGVIAQLAMGTHTETIPRGSIRLSDLTWFATATLFFLFGTHQRLESFRWS